MRDGSGRPRAFRFDPVTVGQYETDAWVAYYRREWVGFLRASIGMVSAGFRMSRLSTVRGAWLVLRANQVWAPYPDNDPDAARAYMRGFYALVCDDGLPLDPAEAARLEVEWWRVHRVHQREDGATEDDLVAALESLYSYVYRTDPERMRAAAVHRVEAMRLSDAWVESGCRLSDPVLRAERRELVASYTALRDAIDRISGVPAEVAARP